MACAHCMKGDAQSIDLATEHIDALLDQTKQIEYLMFTGGEPTLNIEGMRYFLDGCIKRNIKIEYLNLTINGKVATNEMAQLLLDFDDWIAKYSDKRYYDGHILLWISKDRFHDDGFAEKAFDYYSNKLKNRTHIKVQLHKIAAYKVTGVGRAKDLKNQFLFVPSLPHIRRIEYLNTNNASECYCPYRKHEIVPKSSNVSRVLCSVFVTAKGAVISSSETYDASYADLDANSIFPIVCHVTDPIFEKIIEYNKRPVELCVEKLVSKTIKDHLRTMTMDAFTYMLYSIIHPNITMHEIKDFVEDEYSDVAKKPDAESPVQLFSEYLKKHPDYQTIADLHSRFPWLYLDEWETYLRCENDLKNESPQIRKIALDTMRTCEQLNDVRKAEENDQLEQNAKLLHSKKDLNKNEGSV